MKYNPQLIEFLNANHQNLWIGIPQDDSFWTMFITECRVNGWIEIESFEWEERIMKYRLTDAGKRALGTDTGDGGSVVLTPDFEEVSIEVYWTESHAIEVRAPNMFSGLRSDLQARTKFVVTYGGGDPITAFDNIKDAIAYVDKREQHTATPQADSEATGYTVVMEDGYAAIYRDDDSTITNHVATFDYASDASVCIEAIVNETANLRAENARLQAELDTAQERVSELEGAINRTHAKIKEARDLQFEQKYSSADSSMKNAQVILDHYITD